MCGIGTKRSIAASHWARWVFLSLAVFLVAPASASAAAGDPDTVPEGRGLPFSLADLGWITLAAASLVLLVLVLQLLAGPRRRAALRAIGHSRTDP